MEQPECLVVLHLQYMAVAADEELWRTGIELMADAEVVASRVAADVGQQHVSLLATEPQHLGKHSAQLGSVAVAHYSAQCPKGGQTVGNGRATDVAGVPYLVALLEIFEVAIVPVGVGVGEDSYAFHGAKIAII